MSLARLITSIHNVLNLSLLVPHALKGQKLLAQGSALGNYGRKPVALFYSN